MKRLALTLLVFASAASLAIAALPGADNAADPVYSDGWQNGDNGGTSGVFGAWDLSSNNNGGGNSAGYFIGDSTSGTGDINTNGVSFGIYANPPGAFADANRNFTDPLGVGQSFSITLGVNFRNGNKGFSLESTSGEIFNLNVGGDDYAVNGTSLGLTFSSTATFDLSFTQTSTGAGSFTISYNGTDVTPIANSFNGLATGIHLYNAGTEAGDQNNLYFNNLAIVPEPSTWVMVAGGLGLLTLLRRRRTS